MDGVAWAIAGAGLLVHVVTALAPVQLTLRWRACVRGAGHLALQGHLRYLLLHVRLRGALLAASPLVGGRASGRVRLMPALGPLTVRALGMERQIPAVSPRPATGRHPSEGPPAAPTRQPAPRARRRAPGSWRRHAAVAFTGTLKGRLTTPRLWMTVKWGSADAAAAAIGAASLQALLSAALARLVRLGSRASPPPRLVVRPAYGQAGFEARGQVVVEVRAAVLMLAAARATLAAARVALIGPSAELPPQRASSHKAAA